MTYPTDPTKLNKKAGPSKNASIPLRSAKKIITGSRGREGPGWKGPGKKGSGIRYVWRQERNPESQENKQIYGVVGGGECREPLESSRHLGWGKLPGFNLGDLSQNIQQWGYVT